MKATSFHLTVTLFLSGLLSCGCVSEGQLDEQSALLEQVQQQIKQSHIEHPEVEETATRLKVLREELDLMASIAEHRDRTLKKLKTLPSGEGPVKMEFLP